MPSTFVLTCFLVCPNFFFTLNFITSLKFDRSLQQLTTMLTESIQDTYTVTDINWLKVNFYSKRNFHKWTFQRKKFYIQYDYYAFDCKVWHPHSTVIWKSHRKGMYEWKKIVITCKKLLTTFEKQMLCLVVVGSRSTRSR